MENTTVHFERDVAKVAARRTAHAVQCEMLSRPELRPYVRSAIRHFNVEHGLGRLAVLDLMSGGGAFQRHNGPASRYLAVDAVQPHDGAASSDILVVEDPLLFMSYADRVPFLPDIVTSVLGVVPTAGDDETYSRRVRSTFIAFPSVRYMLFGSIGSIRRDGGWQHIVDLEPAIDEFYETVLIQNVRTKCASDNLVLVWRMMRRVHPASPREAYER